MAAKKPVNTIPQDTLDLYDKLVATSPGIERKGATVPYTSLNGNMSSFIGKDGVLGIRLPEEAREKFLKKYNTVLVEAYGMVMKEYVRVPAPAPRKDEGTETVLCSKRGVCEIPEAQTNGEERCEREDRNEIHVHGRHRSPPRQGRRIV